MQQPIYNYEKMKTILVIGIIGCLLNVSPITMPLDNKNVPQAKAVITVDCCKPLTGEVSPAIYGGFIEFIGDCINGPTGMWAQEFRNRGFDEPDEDDDGISGQGTYNWQPLIDSGVSASWAVSDGGYNQRGVYAQQITKINGIGRVGLFQLVPISGRSWLDFYIYLRGDSTVGEITVAVSDINGSYTYAQDSLGTPNSGWQKYRVSIPPLSAIRIGRLEISWKGNGRLLLDEASLMPSDNVDGVRREFFELYRVWQPGVLRYPGGCFADSPANHWEFGVGPIDQRQSPNWDPHWGAYQRMDFGTDEFLRFCEACSIEPHLTVNFGSGTPEEAAAWVEYCNGPANSTYGALRATNGHPEPYKVPYWEIGNEQYGDWEIGHTTPEEYGARFVKYYQAMKAVDPSIRIMADGHTNPFWYIPMMRTIGSEIDIFGWHTCHTIQRPASDEDIYLAMLAGSQSTERTIESFWNQAIKAGLAPEMRLSISEWWPVYRYAENSSVRSATMESALWSALHLNAFKRHGDAMETACRTSFIGVVIPTINLTTGHRVIFGSPTYHVFQMYRHHSGNKRLAVTVDCETYNTTGLLWLPAERNVPYLDASGTMSNNSFFLAVVNRHPTDSIETTIRWEGIKAVKGTVHEVCSIHYLDGNDPENPDKITYCSHPWIPSNTYTFPAHSVTILEISEFKKPINSLTNYIEQISIKRMIMWLKSAMKS